MQAEPMRAIRVLIDTNLLVLLVVGRTGQHLISKHRRLQAFTIDDYGRLDEILSAIDQVVVTPNTLTETSNLLAQHSEPERSRFFDVFRYLIGVSQEIRIASVEAAQDPQFVRLGLTDSAVLEVVSAETPLLTADLPLFLAAASKDYNAAFNFWHLTS